MIIYVLSYDMGYDGEQLIGVYDKEEKALEVAKEIGKDSIDSFVIHVMELNKTSEYGELEFRRFIVVRGRIKED